MIQFGRTSDLVRIEGPHGVFEVPLEVIPTEDDGRLLRTLEDIVNGSPDPADTGAEWRISR